MYDDEWKLLGRIFVGKANGIDRVKIYIPYDVFEMQKCYLEPMLRKFSLVINDEMNPNFDYLTRFEEMERIINSNANSVTELILKLENDQLRERIKLLEEEIDIMRKAVNDSKILKEPIIFDGV